MCALTNSVETLRPDQESMYKKLIQLKYFETHFYFAVVQQYVNCIFLPTSCNVLWTVDYKENVKLLSRLINSIDKAI